MLHNFDSKEYTLSPKKKLFVTWDEIAILNPWWIQLTVHPSNNNNNSTPVVNSADFHQISRSLLFYILSKKKKKKKERGEIARGISSHLGNLTRDKGIARPPTGSDGGGWSTLKPGPSISALVRWVFILSASRPVMHLNTPFSFLPSFLFFSFHPHIFAPTIDFNYFSIPSFIPFRPGEFSWRERSRRLD